MNENIIKKIRSLPPLPKSVLEIQRITADPDGSIGDLIKVVKQDPMLTANLLKAANSPLYGFSRQIKTVDQSVSLFGMSTVKGFAVAAAVRNSMTIDLSAYGISENQFVNHSQLQNALITNWYKRDRSKLDLLSSASFLLDIGAVIISSLLVSEDKASEFKSKLSDENRKELEEEYIGSNTTKITAEIFNHWKFDQKFVDAIKFSDSLENIEDSEIKEYAAALHITGKIVTLNNPFSEENIKASFDLCAKYGLNIGALEEAINIIK
jgi:HD-like signal output (HDOD) protein